MKIFNLEPLQEPSFLQRLFKIAPSENAIIEVNNLLAENEKNIKSVTVDNIISILGRYKTDLRHEFKASRIALFTS